MAYFLSHLLVRRALALRAGASTLWAGASTLLASALCALALSSCAWQQLEAGSGDDLPLLRLSPASLGRKIALQSRMTLSRNKLVRHFDALLEVDDAQVRLLVSAMGASAVEFHWNGRRIEERRAPWLPAQVSGERVLRDLQFSLWPLSSVRAALPAQWQALEQDKVQDNGQDKGQEPVHERRLIDPSGQVRLIATISGKKSERVDLANLKEGYSLQILSVDAGANDVNGATGANGVNEGPAP